MGSAQLTIVSGARAIQHDADAILTVLGAFVPRGAKTPPKRVYNMRLRQGKTNNMRLRRGKTDRDENDLHEGYSTKDEQPLWYL